MSALDYAGLVARVRACREAGDYLRADAVAWIGIAAVERGLGPDSRELAALFNERGILGKYLGQFAESERHYRRALAIYARCGEVASADIAAILHNLGGLAHERGDHQTAYGYARRGLEIREALAEPDPLALAQDRAAFAAILVDLHRYDEAETLLAGALATYESWYGPGTTRSGHPAPREDRPIISSARTNRGNPGAGPCGSYEESRRSWVRSRPSPARPVTNAAAPNAAASR